MKKFGNKDELIVYGEQSIQLLQHIIDGISNNPVKSTTYSIDFSRLKKLKLGFRLCRHLCANFSDPPTVKTRGYTMQRCVFAQKL